MHENYSCQQGAGVVVDDELYLFAADANAELDNLRCEHRQLVQKYQAAVARCIELETALNRALAVLAAQEVKKC